MGRRQAAILTWGIGNTSVSRFALDGRLRCMVALRGTNHSAQARARLGFWAHHSQGTVATVCRAATGVQVTDITAVTVMGETPSR